MFHIVCVSLFSILSLLTGENVDQNVFILKNIVLYKKYSALQVVSVMKWLVCS